MHTEKRGRGGLKHAFTTWYKVKSEIKQEVSLFFLCHRSAESLSAPREGIQRQNGGGAGGKEVGGVGGGGGSLDSWGMYRGVPFVSRHLRIKCPPLSFRQSAEGKAETWCEGSKKERKTDSTHFRYFK